MTISNSSDHRKPNFGTSSAASPVKTSFGLTTLCCVVVASMVGSGVFTTSGYTMGAVGSSGMVLLCWTIGGIIALSGAVAYGQLARLMPESGGEYLFLSRNVHPFAGFLAGWTSLTAGFSGAIAYAAVLFEEYAVPDQWRPEWLPPDTLAIGVVVVTGCAHLFHAGLGARIQNAVVFIKLFALVVFIFIAAWVLPGRELNRLPLPTAPSGAWQMVAAVATSVVWISLSYAGFNAAVYVASESAQASRSVPRALLLGTAIVTLLYLTLNFIFVSSTQPHQVAWQEDIAAISAVALGGRKLEVFVRVIVCFGLLSSVSGMIMTGPRVYSQMAQDGLFPARLRVDAGGIPRSILLQMGLACGLILVQRLCVWQGWLSSSLLGLLIYLSTTLSVSSACCAASLFLPRVRQLAGRSCSVPVMIATAIYVAATLGAVAVLVCSHKVEGIPQGIWHLTGMSVVLITGAIVWSVFPQRNGE